MQSVEMALEGIHMSRPETAELRQPSIDLAQRFWLQSIAAALCIHGRLHETGVPQHSQVLGNRGLRHSKLTLDLAHRLLGQDEEAQNRAPVRLCNNLEYRIHEFLYTSIGIYSSRNI